MILREDDGMVGKILAVGLLCAGMALGQRPVASKTIVVAVKPIAFDVVSIRPSKPGSPWGGVEVLPDGYRAWGIGLWATVAKAYFPDELYFPERIQGLPSWTKDEKYDIQAKVAPVDVVEWQRQTRTRQQRVMLQAMLQAMLAERCKLVVHSTPVEIHGLALVVGKHGPKLTETPVGEKFPADISPFPDGGGFHGYRKGEPPQATFYGTSMESFAKHLCGMSSPFSVEDKTGLAGKYDFVLSWFGLNPETTATPGTRSLDDANPLANWDLAKLGLKVEPIKIPSETLVIDHMERPSAN